MGKFGTNLYVARNWSMVGPWCGRSWGRLVLGVLGPGGDRSWGCSVQVVVGLGNGRSRGFSVLGDVEVIWALGPGRGGGATTPGTPNGVDWLPGAECLHGACWVFGVC